MRPRGRRRRASARCPCRAGRWLPSPGAWPVHPQLPMFNIKLIIIVTSSTVITFTFTMDITKFIIIIIIITIIIISFTAGWPMATFTGCLTASL